MAESTLIIHHLFTDLALTIMALRIVSRKLLFPKLNLGDFCTMAAMLCAAARGGMIHVVLVWGTNNISTPAQALSDFTPDEIHRRTIGSKLVIANRPVYNTYLWLQKSVLLHFFLRNFQSREHSRSCICWLYSAVFFTTWAAVQIIGFTECDPVSLYWQVSPAPGKCVQAQLQLVVLGVLNIVTDMMLLALPIPTLISLQTPWRTKVRLYTLCALGLFIVAITIIRLPINALHASVQANRTTWASTELLAAAVAVNAPTLYGAINHWRRRIKTGSYNCKPLLGTSCNTRKVVNCVKPESLHKEDDEGSILNSHCHASVHSEAATQESQTRTGIPMETFKVSSKDSINWTDQSNAD